LSSPVNTLLDRRDDQILFKLTLNPGLCHGYFQRDTVFTC